MTMPGVTRGSAVSTSSNASVPPVDVPMATTRSVVRSSGLPSCAAGRIASAVSLAATGTGAGAAAARAASRRTLAWLAARTAASSSAALSLRKSFRPSLGLVMIETAPAASAAIVVSAPFSVSVEQITTGVGRSAMIFLRKVMPSMRGISTSRMMTSGQACFMRSIASSGSDTACSSRMPGAFSSIVPTTLRTTAESSTTITSMFFMRVCGRRKGSRDAASRPGPAGSRSGR